VTVKQTILMQWRGIWHHLPRLQMRWPCGQLSHQQTSVLQTDLHMNEMTHVQDYLVALLIIAKYHKQPRHPVEESHPSTLYCCPEERERSLSTDGGKSLGQVRSEESRCRRVCMYSFCRWENLVSPGTTCCPGCLGALQTRSQGLGWEVGVPEAALVPYSKPWVAEDSWQLS
jgi:hypothetical protein